jgi:serine/threonine-protein kinase
MSRMTDQIGRVLGGRYRLIAPIGSGASAQVYLADDVRLRRRVAVKVLHAALAEDESFLRRFRAEAQAAAALNHPNNVAVYDWGEDDTPFIVTEYLGGGSLRSLLDQGTLLTPSQALLVGLEATRALEHAHRRGFVHRDIKPANLLFGDDGRLRIADFGLARALAEAAWTEPVGAMLGTARYASPEQAKGEPVDGRGDVYSLGLTLVESVTGRVPFTADTTIATLMARVDKQVEVPASLGALRRPLERAGRPDPAERPDAGELAVAFMAAAEDMPRPEPLPLAGAMPVVDLPDIDERDETLLVASATDGPPTVLFDLDDHDTPGDTKRRRRWPMLALTMLLALVLGGGVAYAVVQARVPTYTLPKLTGLSEEQARTKVGTFGFSIKTKEDRLDGSTPGQVLAQSPLEGKKLKKGGTLTLTISLGSRLVDVPVDLAGKTEADARAMLGAQGLLVATTPAFDETNAPGIVLGVGPHKAQEPKGTTITLSISQGPAPRTVPDGLVGATFDEAVAKLAAVRLGATKVEAFDDTVPVGQVISTDPASGKPAARDSAVKVTVSKGPDVVEVPRIDGKTLEQAIATLEAAGLTVNQVYGPAKGQPFDTQPHAGTKVKRGTPVDIYLRR